MKQGDNIVNKSNRGITIITLVISIIVIIILAGVSITLLLDENGLIQMAKKSSSAYNIMLIK